MHFSTLQIDGPKAYLLPLADIHFGDRAFGRKGRAKLKGNLDWLVDHQEEARGLGVGDWFNIAGRTTKTSPFETNPEELEEAEEFFRPYAPLIVGACRGNHCQRAVDQFGYDPLKLFCKHLNIPYWGLSAILKVQVGLRPESSWYWQTYYVAVHHTVGGGGSLGNALNATTKIEKMFEGCDVFLGGHNHQLASAVRTVYYPTPTGIKERKISYVACGSYLDFPDSYAERGCMTPGKLGSPRLRLSGERDKHDLHVSI